MNILNSKQRRDDALYDKKSSENFETRFQERKLDYDKNRKRSGLDFENLIDPDLPKDYIPQLHDNDIEILTRVNELGSFEYLRNSISHDNMKLLLQLMKNKKAALCEKNFYISEYSTDFEEITKDQIDRTYNTKQVSPSDDYVGQLITLLENSLPKKDNINKYI